MELDNRIINELRKSVRIKDRGKISWHIDGSEFMGEGKIRNISSTGMQMETKSVFSPTDEATFTFNPLMQKSNYIPQKARLIWHKKANSKENAATICGFEFVDVPQDVFHVLSDKIARTVKRAKYLLGLNKVVSFLLILAILGLICFSIWLSGLIHTGLTSSNSQLVGATEQQAGLYNKSQAELMSSQKMFQESQDMLSGVNADLSSTKSILAETQQLLEQARAENSLTQGEYAKAKADLEAKVAALESQNSDVSREMQDLQTRLSFYDGDISSMGEGKSLLKLYKQRVKEVKTKIKGFKKEAHRARISAMRERDRVRALIGNNGFLVKDGKTVEVDMEKYNALSSQGLEQKKNVEIDVNFVD